MKFMGFNSFLFLLFFFLQACTENCKRVQLDVTQKEWVIHFKKGQKVTYRNAKGVIDTLCVDNINNYYTKCNKVELSETESEIYLVAFKFFSKNAYNHIEPFITITTEGWKGKLPYIYLGNLGPIKINSENPDPVAIDTVLAGRKLTSVYHYANGINVEQYGEHIYFTCFFWSREEGLIAYNTVNNGLFVRVGNDSIPNK